MRKKVLLLLFSSVVLVTAGVVALSAYEAHVVNVTAHIENALKILPLTKKIDFGTVFPQEHRERSMTITTSESFCESTQTRVTNIDYKIVQKPKPIWPEPGECGQYFNSIEDARAYCHDSEPLDLNCCYPSLCPYLSKIPVYTEPGDIGVPSFHDPEDPSSIAVGTINKDTDLSDEWTIDLDVPCFEGMCAQDWTHQGWELDPALEESTFGCDLWIEATDIY